MLLSFPPFQPKCTVLAFWQSTFLVDLTELGLSSARNRIKKVLILVKRYQTQGHSSTIYVVWLWLCSLQDFNSTNYILWVYCGYIVGILWVWFGYTVGNTVSMLWVYCGYTVGMLWQQVAYSPYGQWAPPQGTYFATPDQVIACNQPIVQQVNDNLYDSTRSITIESKLNSIQKSKKKLHPANSQDNIVNLSVWSNCQCWWQELKEGSQKKIYVVGVKHL